jgi:hypothetical protein
MLSNIPQSDSSSDVIVWQASISTVPSPIATRVPTTATRVPRTATPAAATVAPTLPIATRPGYKYPAPRLISPSSGANYGCARDLVLQWSMEPATALGENEWFIVEARPMNSDAWTGLADWTREQTVSLHPTKQGKNCDIAGLPEGTFEWRVRVVQGDRSSHALGGFLSLPSASLIINYGH